MGAISSPMLFASREPPAFLERVRVGLWPRRSWSRSARYFLLRLKRLRATPHQIAIGCAAGVFASITPLFGFQMILAALLARLARGSIAAALIGTFAGNPLSWPIIWGSTYATGCLLLGIDAIYSGLDLGRQLTPLWTALASGSPGLIGAAWDTLSPILRPMLAGSLPLGLATAGLSYYLSRRAVAAYQSGRPVPATSGAGHG